jgi:FHS family L-fucose permease-like MFS transporter
MSERAQRLLAASITVTTLFFAWGFITSMVDPLIPSVRAIFSLSYTESMLTQFAFFLAYGVMSLPAGLIVIRCGYASSILGALLAMVAGSLVIALATRIDTYVLVLLGLFVIASGMTVLQVAANPLAASLGTPERSHFRLTLSQAFNSFGTVLGPNVGAWLMLRGGVFAGTTTVADLAMARTDSLRNIYQSFMIVAALLVLLVAFIWSSRRRLNDAARPTAAASAGAAVLQALKSPWALYGAAAIFLYVGAEVAISSIMINFLHQDDVFGVPLERAGKLLGLFYWGGAMLGRFLGSALLTRIAAFRLLSAVAIAATAFCLRVRHGSG